MNYFYNKVILKLLLLKLIAIIINYKFLLYK
jgi:hypothetical protein